MALLEPRWLQGVFSTLVGLFDRVGLWTNIRKTVSMVCRPYQVEGNQLEVGYGQQMTGEGPSYRERQKVRLQCKKCREEMALGSMAGHLKTLHGQAAEERLIFAASPPGEEPQTYRMAFPTAGDPRSCPVEGCPGRATTSTAMQVHVRDTVVILEEINLPHPRRP